MKKVSLLLFLALIFACQQQKKEKGYEITGTVTQDYTGMVYLQEYKNRKYVNIDSTEIENGKFVFTGSVSEPMIFTVVPAQQSKRAQIFVDNHPMSIDLTSEWEIAKLTGSENAEMFYRLLPESIRGTLKPDSLLLANPASPVAVYFVNRNSYRYDYETLSSLRGKMDSTLNNNPYVQEIDLLIANLEQVQPGKPAPDFTFETPKGDSFTLSSLRGKYVLLDFWASWCPDCRKENPQLVTLYQKYKNKPFTMVGVSIDEDKERWKAAVEKDGLVWHQVIAKNAWEDEVTKAYAIRWIPTGILIDPQGVIVSRSIDLKSLESKLAELFN